MDFKLAAICVVVLLVCGIEESNAQDACFQPSSPGNCYAYFERFYYDAQTGRCKSFVYGGCGGNKNNFDSMPACLRFRHACLRRAREEQGLYLPGNNLD